MLVFEERGKLEYPEKNLSVQSKEPTNSTHLWRRVWESNSDHIGGREVPFPLHHPCKNHEYSISNKNWFFNFIVGTLNPHGINEHFSFK